MRIFISAGEPSGDLHGANLIHSLRKLRPDVEVVGFGGDKMKGVGAELVFPLVDLAVMWFLRVLLNIRKFFDILAMAEREFAANPPDAVVLIDYPGFHWHLAKAAKKHGIPVIYFVPPQLWAWAGWRIKKVRRSIDHLLCSLPFEPKWYHDRGVANAEHIGHPYFDELAERVLDEATLAELQAPAGPLVAILPGSRTQELVRNLPIMARAAVKLADRRPDARFVVACLHDRHRELAARILADAGAPAGLPIAPYSAKTPEIIRAADVAWAVSGSVGLELMMEALPTVVLYKVRPIDLWVARQFIKSKYISLVNLLADAEVMPEYLTAVDVSGDLADHAARWLDRPAERRRAAQALADLRDREAKPGATDRAAAAIVAIVDRTAPAAGAKHPVAPRPHAPRPRTETRSHSA